MQKHPDADAFLRSYLEHPADAVSRLVFADWLEETGEPHLTAWAHFIRLRIEADRYPSDSPERRELDREADKCMPFIRARLTIPASLFVRYHQAFGQLLPFHRIAVRIGHFRPKPFDALLVVEDLARLYPVLPLVVTANSLIVAVTETAPYPDYATDLGNLLGVQTVAVLASREEIENALSDVYPIPSPTHLSTAID